MDSAGSGLLPQDLESPIHESLDDQRIVSPLAAAFFSGNFLQLPVLECPAWQCTSLRYGPLHLPFLPQLSCKTFRACNLRCQMSSAELCPEQNACLCFWRRPLGKASGSGLRDAFEQPGWSLPGLALRDRLLSHRRCWSGWGSNRVGSQ